MKIGVTGAFGFLGANFIASLLDDRAAIDALGGSIEITAFASRTRSNLLFDPRRVRIVGLDIMDRAGMTKAFEGLDAVAHFAGRVDYRAVRRKAVWEADVIGALNVFEAVLEARVPKLLYVSSVSALGSPAQGRLANEESSPYGDPRWPISFASREETLAAVESSLAGDYTFIKKMRVAYFDAKLAGWELAKLYAREKGLPVVTVFPGTVVGAGDQAQSISNLVDKVWEGKLSISLPGASSFVAARDFARGAVLALARGRIGEGYVISGRDEHNMRYADFMRLISAVAYASGGIRRPRNTYLIPPGNCLLAAAWAAETLLPAGSVTKALVLSGMADNRCSSAKAMRELGYQPGPSLEDAIAECRRFSLALRSKKEFIPLRVAVD